MNSQTKNSEQPSKRSLVNYKKTDRQLDKIGKIMHEQNRKFNKEIETIKNPRNPRAEKYSN